MGTPTGRSAARPPAHERETGGASGGRRGPTLGSWMGEGMGSRSGLRRSRAAARPATAGTTGARTSARRASSAPGPKGRGSRRDGPPPSPDPARSRPSRGSWGRSSRPPRSSRSTPWGTGGRSSDRSAPAAATASSTARGDRPSSWGRFGYSGPIPGGATGKTSGAGTTGRSTSGRIISRRCPATPRITRHAAGTGSDELRHDPGGRHPGGEPRGRRGSESTHRVPGVGSREDEGRTRGRALGNNSSRLRRRDDSGASSGGGRPSRDDDVPLARHRPLHPGPRPAGRSTCPGRGTEPDPGAGHSEPIASARASP
jgi:hypothetical protein